jgi:hypothetical protein
VSFAFRVDNECVEGNKWLDDSLSPDNDRMSGEICDYRCAAHLSLFDSGAWTASNSFLTAYFGKSMSEKYLIGSFS